MPNPIAFVDTSYLKGIVLNKNNIPVAVALARLQSLYDLYIAPQILAELTNDNNAEIKFECLSPKGRIHTKRCYNSLGVEND